MRHYWRGILISFQFLVLSLQFIPLTAEEKKINFSADRGEYYGGENKLNLQGNVKISEVLLELKADEITFDWTKKKIFASGNVFFEEKEKTVTAVSVEYNTENKLANFQEARVTFTPWYLKGKKLEKSGEKKFISSASSLTTCELPQPHYYFKAGKLDIVLEDRIYAYSVLFCARGIPFFYLPFYYRSLKERKLTIELYPGYSESEWFYLRTKIGYPVSQHTYGKIYLDYLEKKGWGTGGEYNYNLPDRLRGSVYGYRIKEKDTLHERWNLRCGHWSRLSPTLTATANLNFLNDRDFNNLYFREDWQRRNLNANSNLSFTYSRKNLTAHLIGEIYSHWYQEGFRPQIVYAPKLILVTQPEKIKLVPVFWNFSFDLANYFERTKGYYELKSESAISFTNTYNLSRMFSINPAIGLNVNNKNDTGNLLHKYYNWNLNLRCRPNYSFTADFSHGYQTEYERKPSINHIYYLTQYQPGPQVDWKSFSGYDLITKKKDDWGNQFTYCPFTYLRTYLANVYSLELKSILSWQAELALGEPNKDQLVLGFTYSTPKRYYLRGGFIYSPTPSWRFQLTARQDFSPGVEHYLEKEITVTRDLHCWILNLYYRERPLIKEFWFSLDLKIANQARKVLYSGPQEAEWYPFR